MKLKPLELGLGAIFIAIIVLIGWLIGSDVASKSDVDKDSGPGRQRLVTQQPAESKNSGQTPRRSSQLGKLDPLLARPNERLVQFDNEKDYRKFLSSLSSSNLRLLGSLDSLRAVWIGFDNLADFDGLLDPDSTGYNYLVTLPIPPGDSEVQGSAVGFRGNALEWLGITGDNSQWGKDVIIAVVDTGISAHEALPDNIRHIDLVEGENPSLAKHGHGTAVASLIGGSNELTPGVSPSATLLDIRVADSNGDSSSYKLAEGIVAAVNGGAKVINVSMGSYGDSSLVERAVQYAYESGAVIVASSGNEGFDQPAFPAGYEQVYAVGAVDKEGSLINFSNTGENIDITAPGLEVYAAWTDDRYIEFTGTSASAPYVSAAIATAMSQFGLSATQAADYVMTYANEAGTPGTDTSYGLGHLDVGRVINSETSGIYDIASVSNLVEVGNSNTLITVVQNQGTESITNAVVTLSTPYAEIPLRVSQLSPGEIQTFEVPTALPTDGNDFFVTSEARINQSFQDAEPQNNIKSSTFDFSAEP
ncbi:MAG: S8 family peptidase [Roseibacillus sp.]